jgi:hypothetical protein
MISPKKPKQSRRKDSKKSRRKQSRRKDSKKSRRKQSRRKQSKKSRRKQSKRKPRKSRTFFNMSSEKKLPDLPYDILKKILIEAPNTLKMPISKKLYLTIEDIQKQLVKKFRKTKFKIVKEMIVEFVPSEFILQNISRSQLMKLFFSMLKESGKNLVQIIEFVLEKGLISEYDIELYLQDEDWNAYNITEKQLKNMLNNLTRDKLIFYVSEEIFDEYPESHKENLIDKLIKFGYMTTEDDVYNIVYNVSNRKILIEIINSFKDFVG